MRTSHYFNKGVQVAGMMHGRVRNTSGLGGKYLHRAQASNRQNILSNCNKCKVSIEWYSLLLVEKQ